MRSFHQKIIENYTANSYSNFTFGETISTIKRQESNPLQIDIQQESSALVPYLSNWFQIIERWVESKV